MSVNPLRLPGSRPSSKGFLIISPLL